MSKYEYGFITTYNDKQLQEALEWIKDNNCRFITTSRYKNIITVFYEKEIVVY